MRVLYTPNRGVYVYWWTCFTLQLISCHKFVKFEEVFFFYCALSGIVYFGLNDPLVRFLTFIEKKRNSWSSEDFKRTQNMYWLASDAVQATEVLSKTVSLFKTNILIVSPYLVNIMSFKQYFIEFLKTPPAWVSGQWKLAISSVVQNTFG